MENVEIFNGDCLKLMGNIPDKSIDLIICDLPYGTTACSWDSIISFKELWLAYERIIKENGTILLFGCEPFSTILRMSNLNLFRYDYYWEKSKPSLYQHAKNRPMRKIEIISVFSKAKCGHISQVKNRMKYFPEGVFSRGIRVVTEKFHSKIQGRRPNQVGKTYEAYSGFPNDLLKFNNVPSNKSLHPTQKPVDLLEYLIKTHSEINDLVLDNCMGSGSTGVACINTNRKFIGIELDKEYFEISLNRISEAIYNKIKI